jgi:hypothetical protein
MYVYVYTYIHIYIYKNNKVGRSGIEDYLLIIMQLAFQIYMNNLTVRMVLHMRRARVELIVITRLTCHVLFATSLLIKPQCVRTSADHGQKHRRFAFVSSCTPGL